jgi:hypothetical protein
MKFRSVLAIIIIALITAGCLVSEGAFYDPGDIVQDDRGIGVYEVSGEKNARWTVTRSSVQKQAYSVILQEPGAVTEFTGILFKIDKNLFLDLSQNSASGEHHEPGSAPTMTEIMRGATAGKKHLVLAVTFTDTAVVCRFISREGCRVLLKEDSRMRGYVKDGWLILPPTPGLSRQVLVKHGADPRLFDAESRVLKKNKG